MPALVELSKHDIMEKLTDIIKRQDAEITRLEAELAHLNRKNAHKCNDAWCAECDGPRS